MKLSAVTHSTFFGLSFVSAIRGFTYTIRSPLLLEGAPHRWLRICAAKKGFRMSRIGWYVGVTSTSLLLMATTALAQSFCSDLDGVIKLAPSAFGPILDDANRGAIETGVTRSLPGASRCWYENASGSYWCEWNAPFPETESQVKQLASAVGQCYQVQPDYETIQADNGRATVSDRVFAFVDLPNSISVYINGVADTIAMSIQATDKARRFDNGSGRSSEDGSQED